jgi:DNA-3-methyladenine glycosylase
VLLRALQPEHAIDLMFERRQSARRDTDLCSGPGKLCQALGITRSLDGDDLIDGSRITIERVRQRALARSRIETGPRVGIGYAEEWQHQPLRFWIRGNPHVSKARG